MATTTPNGNISAKIAPGRTYRRMLRIENIARMAATGLYSDTEIAMNQGVTKEYVNMLKRTPEFIAIRTQLLSGIINSADRQMYEDIENKREALRSMLPEALLAIKERILDKSQPALQLKAAQDLLDREGTCAKISKSEIKVTEKYDYSEHDSIATDLLSALRANSSTQDNPVQPDDLEGLGVNAFVNTAISPEAKVKLQESMDIINNFKLTQDSTNSTIQ